LRGKPNNGADVGATLQEEWKRYFVAYEDALASFYSLQEATEQTLEQSRAAAIELNRIASLRMSIGDVKRRLQASADNDRVAEIERDRATVELDGVGVDVLDLVATRGAAFGSVLELSFRIDPKLVPQLVDLTKPVRIRFPFGESTYTASCRLVRFRLVQHEFAFRFAVVDPG
jgi:hypothetical protein